jgi:hypothetical protein
LPHLLISLLHLRLLQPKQLITHLQLHLPRSLKGIIPFTLPFPNISSTCCCSCCSCCCLILAWSLSRKPRSTPSLAP